MYIGRPIESYALYRREPLGNIALRDLYAPPEYPAAVELERRWLFPLRGKNKKGVNNSNNKKVDPVIKILEVAGNALDKTFNNVVHVVDKAGHNAGAGIDKGFHNAVDALDKAGHNAATGIVNAYLGSKEIKQDIVQKVEDTKNSVNTMANNAQTAVAQGVYDGGVAVGKALSNGFKSVVNGVGQIDDTYDNAVQDVRTALIKTGKAVSNAGKNAAEAAKNAVEKTKEMAENVASGLENAVEKVKTTARKVIEGLENNVNELKEEADNIISNTQKKINDLKKDVEKKVDDIKDKGEQTVDDIKDKGEQTVDDIKDKGEQTVDDVKDKGEQTVDDVKDKKDKIVNNVNETKGNIEDTVDYIHENPGQAAIDGYDGATNGAGNVLEKGTDKVVDGLNSAGKKVEELANNLDEWYNKHFLK
jgi:F0F1-type ATP synthase membrane subunit b/b'